MSESFKEVKERVDNSLLVEKYRPTKIEDVLLEDNMKEKFLDVLKSGKVSNLLLSGEPGNGKTTVAKIIAKELSNDNFLFLNASSETGIDTVREKIQPFCTFQSIDSDIKIIVCDEIDGSSMNFQYALKENIEKYAKGVRFIFTSNNPQNIDTAIRSRCQEFKFGNIDKMKIAKRVIEIMDIEKIKYDKKNLANIINNVGTDIRQILNQVDKLTVDGSLTPYTSDNEKNKKIVSFIHNKKLSELRKYLSEENINLDGTLRYMMNNVKDISEKRWVEVMIEIGEIAKCMKLGVDPEIAFSSGIASIMQLL